VLADAELADIDQYATEAATTCVDHELRFILDGVSTPLSS